MGSPPYVKKTFQRICGNPKRGLNRSGGSGPPIPPVATPLNLVHEDTEVKDLDLKAKMKTNDLSLLILKGINRLIAEGREKMLYFSVLEILQEF